MTKSLEVVYDWSTFTTDYLKRMHTLFVEEGNQRLAVQVSRVLKARERDEAPSTRVTLPVA